MFVCRSDTEKTKHSLQRPVISTIALRAPAYFFTQIAGRCLLLEKRRRLMWCGERDERGLKSPPPSRIRYVTRLFTIPIISSSRWGGHGGGRAGPVTLVAGEDRLWSRWLTWPVRSWRSSRGRWLWLLVCPPSSFSPLVS